MTLKILICDDHQLFCEGLKEIIVKNLSDSLILISNDLVMCKAIIQEMKFDVFICDINIHGKNGLDFIKTNRDLLVGTKIIVLSGFMEDYMYRKAMDAGAHHFLKKEVSAMELISSICSESKLNETVVERNTITSYGQDVLSKQEKLIVKQIIEGFTSREIGVNLKISKTTVDTHRRNIHRKLNTNSSAELMRMVYEGKILL